MLAAERSAASWSSYTAKMRVETRGPGGPESPVEQVGYVKFAKPGRLRMQLGTTGSGAAQTQTMVTDGTTTWIEVGSGVAGSPPMVFKMRAGEAAGGAMPGPASAPEAMIAQFREMFDLKVVGDSADAGPGSGSTGGAKAGGDVEIEDIFGEPVHVLAGPYRLGSLAKFASRPGSGSGGDAGSGRDDAALDSLFDSIRIAVSRRTGFIHQIEIFGRPESESGFPRPGSPPVLLTKTTFYDVVIGAQLDAALFEYSPPEGATVNDLTAVEGERGN